MLRAAADAAAADLLLARAGLAAQTPGPARELLGVPEPLPRETVMRGSKSA